MTYYVSNLYNTVVINNALLLLAWYSRYYLQNYMWQGVNTYTVTRCTLNHVIRTYTTSVIEIK